MEVKDKDSLIHSLMDQIQAKDNRIAEVNEIISELYERERSYCELIENLRRDIKNLTQKKIATPQTSPPPYQRGIINVPIYESRNMQHRRLNSENTSSSKSQPLHVRAQS